MCSDDDVYYSGLTDFDGNFAIDVYQSEKAYRLSASHSDYMPYQGDEYLDFSDPEAIYNIMLAKSTSSSVNDVATRGSLKVSSSDGVIVVTSDQAADVVVADTAGRILLVVEGFTGSRVLHVDAGIYIVNQTKVVVR